MTDLNLKKSNVTNFPVGLYSRSIDYEVNNFQVINNTQEEILNVVIEMNSYLNGDFSLSKSDLEKQNIFWENVESPQTLFRNKQ